MKKLLNLFRKKTSKASFSFSVDELENFWPSHPREEQVPDLDKILEAEGPIAANVRLLRSRFDEAVSPEDRVEEQIFFTGRFGQVCLPSLIHKSDGFFICTSQAGTWTEKVQQNYIDWLVRVRACDFIHSLKIVIASEEEIPERIRQASRHSRESLMLMNVYPFIDVEGHKVNAQVFVDAMGYHYPKWEKLDFDEKGLELLHALIGKEFSAICEGDFFFPYLLKVIGAFTGEVIREEFGASWKENETRWDQLVIEQPGKDANPFPIFSWASSYLKDRKQTPSPAELLRNFRNQLS